jgi:hypothetical protein
MDVDRFSENKAPVSFAQYFRFFDSNSVKDYFIDFGFYLPESHTLSQIHDLCVICTIFVLSFQVGFELGLDTDYCNTIARNSWKTTGNFYIFLIFRNLY